MKLKKLDFAKTIKKHMKHPIANNYIIDVLNAIPFAIREIVREGNVAVIEGICEFTTKTITGREYLISVGPRAGEKGSFEDRIAGTVKTYPKFRDMFKDEE